MEDIRLAFVLEYGIPSCESEQLVEERFQESLLTKVCGPSCRNYLALGTISKLSRNHNGKGAHIRATLKDNWLMTGTFTICKGTYGLGRLV